MKKSYLFFFIYFATQCLSAQVKNTVDSGLVAYYPFSGNAGDSSGYANHPVFNNALLTEDRFGNSNNAYLFDGFSSYMKIANAPSLNMNNKMSICVWVKPKGYYTGLCYNNMIIGKGIDDHTPGNFGNYSIRFADYINGCGPSASINNEYFYGPDGRVATNVKVGLDKWYFLVFTTDGITGKLYVNNRLQSASLIGSQTFTNAYDLLLGKWNTPSYPYWFNGVLDDVRIYNRALTRNEVKQLYNSSPTPTIKGTVFVDGNANGIFDGNDAPKANVKVVLSNGEIAFTDINGNYQFDADSIGTYSITANPPHIFAAFPAVDSFYFHSLDTTVIRNFALQQTTLAFDSLSINIIPLINVARPGFPYPVVVTYENTGTSMLNTAINFKYDTTKLRYDSSSNKYAIQNWNIIGITNDTMYPGDRTAFLAYFTVKTTAILGDTVRLYATIAANAVYSIDSVLAQIRGSYDPNSKEATPFLTLPQVQSDADIDYIIRFENTGTDTAFTVVITDTLSTKLRSSSIQMINSSHPCKLTIKDQLLRFEFIDINLPDSHTNRTTCHGFVNFKVKPRTDLSEGSLINNKASIYFDYNLPIVTNTATTLIKPIITPVKLIKYEVQIASLSANNEQQVTNRWITSTELNVSHFNIQRSIDGNNFFTIGKVVAKGASEYTFIDPLKTNSLPTNVFYRLEIIDHNGSKNYSKIRMLNIKPTTSIITVYPNPAKDGITVTTNKQTLNIIPERNMLTLSDIAGKLIKKVLLTSQQQYINISELAKGVYILSFETGEKIKLLKD